MICVLKVSSTEDKTCNVMHYIIFQETIYEEELLFHDYMTRSRFQKIEDPSLIKIEALISLNKDGVKLP